MVRIAIIGAGRVGKALGGRWQAAGHDVVYGVRDPTEPRHAGLGAIAAPRTAVRGADVVLVALPWDATESALADLEVGDAVVLDATNPLAAGARELELDPALSGAELVARWLRSSRVVKALNTTGSANMTDPGYPGVMPAMLVAGNDTGAKQVALELVRELGFEPIDAGPLSAARDLEHLAMLWIRLAYTLGHGPGIAFSLLRR